MKLGIIGAGMIVKDFMTYLDRIENLEVRGIQDIELEGAQALCERYGIGCATTSFDELVATGIDTVYVAVPNYLHFDYCKRALERGLHVIVEKPMASTERETRELAKLAKDRNLLIFEAVTTLYLGNYRKVQEWLPRIGGIKLVQSQHNQYSSRYDAFRAGHVLPAFDPAKSGGAMMDLGLYNLHFVMGLLGEPNDVRYTANVERGVDTSGVLTLSYPNCTALCVQAKDSKGPKGGTIQGTDGVIRTEWSPNVVGKATLELYDGTTEEFDDGMALSRLLPEFTAFIDAIDRNDRGFCETMLEKSIAVSRVQTKARLMAGVRFPADDRMEIRP